MPATKKPAPRTAPVNVRVPPELLTRIDALRGMVPRERFIRHLLDQALSAQEKKR
jgi:predicted DNA binding CopG/RHH family protein